MQRVHDAWMAATRGYALRLEFRSNSRLEPRELGGPKVNTLRPSGFSGQHVRIWNEFIERTETPLALAAVHVSWDYT